MIICFQSSLKFTNEPPQGIKAGLKRTYAGLSQDFLDVCSMPQWKSVLFGVSFLHTVVQVVIFSNNHFKMQDRAVLKK